MTNKIVKSILIASNFFVICIFFLYRGYGWPLGTQGAEAIGVLVILLITLISFIFSTKNKHQNKIAQRSLAFGLWIGLLWTLEICMNNLIQPGLPTRDIYDDIFWGIIALCILGISIYYSVRRKKVISGIFAGLWSGFASGAVACVTALLFIVFGMNFIISDALTITEWSQRGATSETPNISVYFAYQTLAGASMHLIILGLVMGILLGILGGLLGKGVVLVKEQLSSGAK